MRAWTTRLVIPWVACAAALQAQDATFDPPVRIEADGEVIDTGRDAGYAGPLMMDYDGDGLPDLLVSSFSGNIRFFRNVGERSEPRFEEQEPLAAEGEPIRIHNW